MLPRFWQLIQVNCSVLHLSLQKGWIELHWGKTEVTTPQFRPRSGETLRGLLTPNTSSLWWPVVFLIYTNHISNDRDGNAVLQPIPTDAHAQCWGDMRRAHTRQLINSGRSNKFQVVSATGTVIDIATGIATSIGTGTIGNGISRQEVYWVTHSIVWNPGVNIFPYIDRHPYSWGNWVRASP